MQSKSESVNQIEANPYNILPSAACSEPWWRSRNYNHISPTMIGGNASNSSSVEQSKDGESQSDDGLDEEDDAIKESQITSPHSGREQDVETEIFKEINEKSEAPIYEEVKDMVYTHASLSETMRLYPPIPIDGKQALKNDVLPDGTVVKKDGNYGQGHQNFQNRTSAIRPMINESLTQPHQLELVGHSIACASNPYLDPYYAGMMATYGPQPW
ncbi:unnamed protein product [Camellia sinensis]